MEGFIIKKRCCYPVKFCNECKYFRIDFGRSWIYCGETLNILGIANDDIGLLRLSVNFPIPSFCRLEEWTDEFDKFSKNYKSDFDKFLEELR